MKERIEINQEDMLKLLVEKVNLLTQQYRTLHNAYKYDKGKVSIDPLIITESYHGFLEAQGDINRILYLYDIFIKKEPQQS